MDSSSLGFLQGDCPRRSQECSTLPSQQSHRATKEVSQAYEGRKEFRGAVEAAEEETLEVIVDLFDWLDTLEAKQTADVVSHHQGTLLPTNQAAAKRPWNPP